MTYDDVALDWLKLVRNEGASLGDVVRGVERSGRLEARAESVRDALERLQRQGQVTRAGTKWFPTPGALKNAPRSPWPAEFQPEDHWILLALMFDEDPPSPLDRIIAVADYINHALPTIEELHGALNRLASAGLIRARSGSFELTKKGLDLNVKLSTRPNMRAVTDCKALGYLLRCPCCGPRLPPIRWVIPLSDDDYKTALETYRRNSEAALKPFGAGAGDANARRR